MPLGYILTERVLPINRVVTGLLPTRLRVIKVVVNLLGITAIIVGH